MNKFSTFWNRNTQNKIIVSIIGVVIFTCAIAFCVVSGITAWILTSTPQTPAIITQQATSIPATPTTRPPTSTPTPLVTNENTQETVYRNELINVLEEFASLWREFNIFTSYASKYPEAIDDPEWRDEFKDLLTEMDRVANKLEELPPPPPELNELNRIILDFSSFSKDATRVMGLYLDTQDETLINDFSLLLEEIQDLQAQLNTELERLGWK